MDFKYISLGGAGGCGIAQYLKILNNNNQPTYPYDWIVSSQSFIINSFYI